MEMEVVVEVATKQQRRKERDAVDHHAPRKLRRVSAAGANNDWLLRMTLRTPDSGGKSTPLAASVDTQQQQTSQPPENTSRFTEWPAVGRRRC